MGPWVGGLAIGAGFGYPVVAWIGAGLDVAALGTVGLAALLDKRVRTSDPATHAHV
ncbi:hypothetical protein ACGFNP_57110 [Nonomuraea sp. NPDC049269]|uniref:hypothetical protein n=1 Tax=Nonomuraea sp. NPDC049269 TaxID=3364349 RepID=UPI00371964B3